MLEKSCYWIVGFGQLSVFFPLLPANFLHTFLHFRFMGIELGEAVKVLPFLHGFYHLWAAVLNLGLGLQLWLFTMLRNIQERGLFRGRPMHLLPKIRRLTRHYQYQPRRGVFFFYVAKVICPLTPQHFLLRQTRSKIKIVLTLFSAKSMSLSNAVPFS